MVMSIESATPAQLGERELRRRIDACLGRALVDRQFADRLLADPTLVLEAADGCTPQQYIDLRGIRATSLRDFAVQAEALFWPQTTSLPSSGTQAHSRPVAGRVALAAGL